MVPPLRSLSQESWRSTTGGFATDTRCVQYVREGGSRVKHTLCRAQRSTRVAGDLSEALGAASLLEPSPTLQGVMLATGNKKDFCCVGCEMCEGASRRAAVRGRRTCPNTSIALCRKRWNEKLLMSVNLTRVS